MGDLLTQLKSLDFGQRVAEEELERLSEYFVATDQWLQLYNGQVDVVLGSKGSGKSALFFLLQRHKEHFAEEGVLLVPAENPRGAAAFRDLSQRDDLSERELTALWKLYFCCILAQCLHENGIQTPEALDLNARLDSVGVEAPTLPLRRVLSRVLEYVERFFRRPSAAEVGMSLDPNTGLPSGFSGKVVFSEPSAKQRDLGCISVDELLSLADRAFSQSRKSCWILLDRLDAAFDDNEELERNALRALFRVYIDLNALNVVFLKIFLRSDIWERITTGGFREASHITRQVCLRWGNNDLLNLMMRRLLSNPGIGRRFQVSVDNVLGSIANQRSLFFRVFPNQVDVGPNKPNSLDWVLSRTRDGTNENTPRELIHFFGCLRALQVRAIEVGDKMPEGERFFSRLLFKAALIEVSEV